LVPINVPLGRAQVVQVKKSALGVNLPAKKRALKRLLKIRVLNTYLEFPFFAFLDFSAPHRISKLRIFNREQEFKSTPARSLDTSNRRDRTSTQAQGKSYPSLWRFSGALDCSSALRQHVTIM
jgi:hypothetical protein